MNRYKMRPGTTISDIEEFFKNKKGKYQFGKGGSWISQDAEHYLMVNLYEGVSLDISFPKDLEIWNDYIHVLVVDEFLCQPYSPFYYQIKHPEGEPEGFLKIVFEKYDKIMDSFPFLVKK